MKRLSVLLTLILATYIEIIANVRVLSIGISEYPESSGWNKINAHNDVELIKSLFPNVSSLENAEATNSEIKHQLKALANNVIQGDTVIIHFSGHGQQIITHASTEEADGVDEALVPYDAGKRKTTSYHGQNHLTDDFFGNAIDKLRRAVGGKGLVITLLDACHSDSMDKDVDVSKEIYRGTDEIFGAEKMPDEKIASLREAYHNQDITALNGSTDMGNVVYISACRSDQRNYEVSVDGKGYGSLTYYFCESYRNKGLSDLHVLLSELHSGMANDKTLKFHGQLPAIRNTLGWEAPSKTTSNDDDGSGRTSGASGDPVCPTYQTVIWSIIGAGLILIFIALWITKKRKK